MATAVARGEKVRNYLKFRAVSSRRERIAVWFLIPVVMAIVLMFWGIPPLNIIPVWGPSMQPTLTVWNIPEPWDRFSFSGWVHYDPDIKPEIGNIVYFKVPNTRVHEVKRVTKINGSGELWVEPDNWRGSGEGSGYSDLYEWVPGDWVKGIVVKAYNPKHWDRRRHGQEFENRVELRLPRDIIEFKSGRRVAVGDGVFYLILHDSWIRFTGQVRHSNQTRGEDRNIVRFINESSYKVGLAFDLDVDTIRVEPVKITNADIIGPPIRDGLYARRDRGAFSSFNYPFVNELWLVSDGDVETGWTGYSGAWIQVDCGEVGNWGLGFVAPVAETLDLSENCRVLVSNDGGSWSEVTPEAMPLERPLARFTVPGEYRYVRVEALDGELAMGITVCEIYQGAL